MEVAWTIRCCSSTATIPSASAAAAATAATKIIAIPDTSSPLLHPRSFTSATAQQETSTPPNTMHSPSRKRNRDHGIKIDALRRDEEEEATG